MVAESDGAAEEAADRPDVSVVIPCHNHADFLGEAIQSVVDQTRGGWEIIVVDDGSEYQQKRAIQKIAEGHVLVRQSNRGLPAARNAGIREARGEYVVCLDADDRLLPAYLERTVALATPTTIICPGLRMFGERHEEYLPQHPLEGVGFSRVPRVFLDNPIFQSSLYSKGLWQRVRGYDENMVLGYEDWEFWIRLAKAGAHFELIPEPLYEYRVRQGSMISSAERNHTYIVAYMAMKHPEMIPPERTQDW